MEKVYVGNAKAGEGQYGGYLKVSLSQEDLNTISRYANGKGYTTLFISKRKEVSQYGHTHSIVVAPPKEEMGATVVQGQPVAPVTPQGTQNAPMGTTGQANPFNNDQSDTIPF